MFETLIGFLLVSGNAYGEASALNGELRELQILRPDRMSIIPGDDGWPEAYGYALDGMSPIRLESAASAIDIHNAASRKNVQNLKKTSRTR